jgi:aubergine-like protein
VIRESVEPSIQLVCAIIPTPRDDRYAAVKKLCCVEKPVASQVINFKTISNEKKVQLGEIGAVSSVVQKVALKINCKLGGELWGCTIPLPKLMVVGVDVYHDPSRRGPSIAGIVSSTNPAMSRWYSSTAFQPSHQELIDALKPAFVKAIREFHRVNHIWPEKILVFRDGVGDSQLSVLAKYEAEQFRDTFRHIAEDYQPSFGFIVVQKRINTRIFAIGGKTPDNPAPGTVLDHTVTKRDWYDFFLVSQHVGQGTVSPTHYIVVHDNTGLKPDIIQKVRTDDAM